MRIKQKCDHPMSIKLIIDEVKTFFKIYFEAKNCRQRNNIKINMRIFCVSRNQLPYYINYFLFSVCSCNEGALIIQNVMFMCKLCIKNLFVFM